MPLRKIRSSTTQTSTTPQPMKMADEYRFVTGGPALEVDAGGQPEACGGSA